MVVVTNLKTGETLEYSCHPRQAVVAAHHQFPEGVKAQTTKSGALKVADANTWDYDLSEAKVTANGRTTYCGDWSSIIAQEEAVQ